ncbi:MAG TPA: ATP-binding protein [Pyrinomonadaceae bacterium]|jgi:anti-sigma regulatory factor (Ser/Thr protein kinase)
MREIESIEVRDEAQVGAARRAVHAYARGLGFTERELAELDIVVQEIGTNAVRYATRGGWLHCTRPLGAEPGVELCYWDKGPGIYDLDRAVRDGVSTSGSLGAGLGTIRRFMDEFDAYSTVRATGALRPVASARRTTCGTALLGRKWVAATRLATEAHGAAARRVGVWSRPHPDETHNGDAYFVRRRGARLLCAVIDGLGHGRGAQEAAQAARDTLAAWQGEPLEELFAAAHDALRPTRGAAMGAVVVDAAQEQFHYAGVGNIDVRVFDAPEHARPISANGTLGARFDRARVWSYKWAEGTTVVLASDGLSAKWDLLDYPGLLQKSPQLLAAVLMRDYARDTDDATVLVAR